MPAEPQLPYGLEHAFQFLVQATQTQESVSVVIDVDIGSGVTITFRTWHPKSFMDKNAKFPGISFRCGDRVFGVCTGVKGRQDHFHLYERSVGDTHAFMCDIIPGTFMCSAELSALSGLDRAGSLKALVRLLCDSSRGHRIPIRGFPNAG